MSVIDTASHAVASIAVGDTRTACGRPRWHPCVRGCFADAVTAGWVSVIDTATNTVGTASPWALTLSELPSAPTEKMSMSPFQRRHGVGDRLAANTVARPSPRVAVRTSAVSPDGARIYVPNWFDHTVSVISQVFVSRIGTCLISWGNIRWCRRRWRWLARHRQPLLQDPAAPPIMAIIARAAAPHLGRPIETAKWATLRTCCVDDRETTDHLTTPRGLGAVV